MPELTMTALEFPGLLQVVQHYAVSMLGRSFLAHLEPSAHLALIQAKFQEIRELQDLEDREGPLPLSPFPDLAPWLAKAAVPGSLLPPEAFNDILSVLRLTSQVRHYLALGEAQAPRLTALAGRLVDLAPLKEAIVQCVSPHSFILDQASPELGRVRRELSHTREQILREIKQTFFGPKYQNVIQSPTISQRHGRYVISLKADHKGAIPGIIHDQSQTKATLYLEPLPLVEKNNAVNLLINQEKREEEAVLRRLTDRVRHAQEELARDLATLAELDAINAKGQFARDFQAREPILSSRGGVNFRQARHPLLLKRQQERPKTPKVVPIDLKLTERERWLIISGANAGGKTVALKTLGLLTLMVQSGIPIPVAEGSSFAPFDRVFADIGDPQDLHQDLSTFSAHLKRALEMLARLPEKALILLDELGTATDPTEGGALAIALLMAFYRRGAYGAVTTHLPTLKALAQREPGFKNVAVVFDEETRRPTYALAYGVAGASNALKIARELGLSPEILAEAEGYLDQEELRNYRLLGEIEAAQEHLAHRGMELARRQQELEAQARELEARREELAAQEQQLLGEAQQQARASIRAAEAEFKGIIKRLRQGEETWGKLRQEFSARQAELLEQLTPGPGKAAAVSLTFSPGQKVFLPALGLTGEVMSGPGHDGRLTVRVRKVKLRVSAEEVSPAGAEKEGAASLASPGFHLPTETLPRLNVVGLRVDEALPLVDRLLDQALMHGAEKVDIVHGMGTGRLKQAVWEHLKHHAAVKDLHPDANPGVTVVDLKD
ncbi:MAG: Smr/MutS family protein [Thermodesulfobacteriota bacterium]